MKTSLLLSHQPTAEGTLVRALLTIEGEAPDTADRAPLNLALVVDRSGSMGGPRIQAARHAAAALVRRLHPNDRVSVVAFDHEVETVVAPGQAADHDSATRSILGITARGSTNLSGGWLQGRRLLDDGLAGHDVNRLILLSDGHANQGITHPDALRDLAATAASTGISTTTIGVGAGFDEELLIAMAEAGVGTHYFMERVDQANDIFDEELLGLLSISAQNLEARVRPDDRVLQTTVLHSYPASTTDTGALSLAIGDLYAREPRSLLIEFVMDEVLEGEPTPVAELTLRADVLQPGGGMEHRTLSLPIEFTPTGGAVTHPEVEKVRVLLEAARAREAAVERADDGDLDGAVQMLREASLTLHEVGLTDEEIDQEREELESTASVMEAQQAYSSADRKYLRSQADLLGKGKRSAGKRGRR